MNVPIQFKLDTEHTPDFSVFRKTKNTFYTHEVEFVCMFENSTFFTLSSGHQIWPVTSPKTSSLTLLEKYRPETRRREP